MRRLQSILVLSVVLVSILGPTGGSSVGAPPEPCGKPDHPSGEWPSYGHDLTNSRNQTREREIGVSNVTGLKEQWSFSSISNGGGTGAFQSTPVVAGGCVFMTSASIGTPTTTGPFGEEIPIDFDQYAIGWVFAVDAATGELVWRTTVGPVASINFFGGIFAPAVADGRVHVLVGSKFPVAVALDQHTGEEVWRTNLIDPGVNGALASSVVFDGLVFAAVVGGDASHARTPFFILDAETGEILKQTYFHTLEEWVEGHAGGGSWTTAAVDSTSKNLYIGMSNPYGRIEDEFNNSIVKIDVDPNRETFGEVVGIFVGTRDNDPERGGDVDFGASPNLFTTTEGRLIVGDLQKSGEYHAVDARTMKRVWTVPLAPAHAAGNAATAAFDGKAIYVTPNKGLMVALDKTTGRRRWVSRYPETSGHYQPTSIANGVVYTINHPGDLVAFDARTGKLLLKKRLQLVTGTEGARECIWSVGGSVAIAGGQVYAACDKGPDGGGFVVAYALD